MILEGNIKIEVTWKRFQESELCIYALKIHQNRQLTLKYDMLLKEWWCYSESWNVLEYVSILKFVASSVKICDVLLLIYH